MEKYFDINEDGLSIKCKMYCSNPRNFQNVVISCHGFGGSKENNASKKLAQHILENRSDIAVISFDWPCHGKDVRQKLHLFDCDKYFNKVIDYVKKSFNPEDLYLNATSFGGYLSLKYIKEHGSPFTKMAFRCPAVNMKDVLYNNILLDEDRIQLSKGKDVISGFERKIRISPNLIKELIDNDITKWDFREYADDILIVHGTKDELVSFDVVKSFADQNGIGFVDIEGADHMFTNPARLTEATEFMTDFLFEKNRRR